MITTSTGEPARCLRCGRRLTRTTGYGRVCRARIRTAAHTADLAEFTAAQVDKARDAADDGAVVPTNRPTVYRAVSSRGDTTYLTAASGQCNCPAGLWARGRPCYHVAAVRILEAARPARRAA